eukprot:scaffold48121_cov54-Cyclotella_meneghiniana.AAC.6
MSGDIQVVELNDNWRLVKEGHALIHIHNFADLPQEKGQCLESPTFTCVGHDWYLCLYPRGNGEANEGMVSVYLCTNLSSKIVIDYDIIMRKENGDNFMIKSDYKVEYSADDGEILGCKNYVSDDEIFDEIFTWNASYNGNVQETLTIEVRIRLDEGNTNIPKSSVADDFYNFYQDEDTADVAFKVEARVFYAHKVILKLRVPELAQIAGSSNAENPIPISDVEPDIFETMLKNVYGKDICATYWKEHAKQILDASGKYGFAKIKSVAEVWHVNNLKDTLSVDNVVDELLYADGKNCPLLKKSTMDFILEHGEEVIDSESYEKLDESPELRKEVMRAFASSKKRKRDD